MKVKQPKPYTKKQSVYVSILTEMLRMGHSIGDAIFAAKQVANEINKL